MFSRRPDRGYAYQGDLETMPWLCSDFVKLWKRKSALPGHQVGRGMDEPSQRLPASNIGNPVLGHKASFTKWLKVIMVLLGLMSCLR